MYVRGGTRGHERNRWHKGRGSSGRHGWTHGRTHRSNDIVGLHPILPQTIVQRGPSKHVLTTFFLTLIHVFFREPGRRTQQGRRVRARGGTEAGGGAKVSVVQRRT